MAKSTESTAPKKRTKKVETASIDPFAETADGAPAEPVKKPKAARTARSAKPASADASKPGRTRTAVKAAAAKDIEAPKSVRKTARKTKALEIDPFADVADTAPAMPKKAVKKSPAKRTVKTKKAAVAVIEPPALPEPEVELSPVFLALRDVTLPELERENRAQLLVQSPTRIYFYWSVRANPWQQLKGVFGNDLGSYTLVVKLTDLTDGSEQIDRCDAEGNWWFTTEPDHEYRAEIGFYAVNRPYFRIIYSNQVRTPRRSPSTHPSTESRWTISATKFAEVLDASGFSRDAYDVAMAGDDVAAAENTTHTAFRQFIGNSAADLSKISADDIRYVMLALASGVAVHELNGRISPALFAMLQASIKNVGKSSARAALKEHFEIDGSEWHEEEAAPVVFGASLVNFPKTLKPRNAALSSPRYNPVSSHSLRQ